MGAVSKSNAPKSIYILDPIINPNHSSARYPGHTVNGT
ncbi:unnamed protein product, partial [Rotaria magnacalcarata]